MRTLDDELRDALRAEEPPDGFVDRVLARLPAEPSQAAPKPAPSRAWWLGLAAAAALAVTTGGVWLAAPRTPEPNVVKIVIPAPEPSRPDSAPPKPAPPPVQPSIEEVRQPGPKPAPRRIRPVRPRESVEAVRAAETLRTALQLTSGKLRHAQRETREALFAPES